MRALLPLFLLAPLASADVRVVSSMGPYTTIQAAVNAANDGDLVLVKPGSSYAGFHVQAKSLAIVADAGLSDVTVQGTVIVSDLAAGQTVTVTGLNAYGSFVGTEGLHYGFYANNNLGSVRCQSCRFYGLDYIIDGGDGFDAARIVSSSDVSLVACTTEGGDCFEGYSWTVPVGGSGARFELSNVTIMDSSLLGGMGWEGAWGTTSGGGGPGLVASNSTVFVSGGTTQGGQGGDGYGAGGPAPAPGGFGIGSFDGAVVRQLDSVTSGGMNGAFVDGPDDTGNAPTYAGLIFNFLVGSRRTLTVAPNPLREFQSVNLSFHGAPGEQVYLLVGLETAVQWDPLRLANLLIAPPQYRTLFLGTTNASGDLSKSLPFGDLGGTVQSQTYFLQPLFSGAGGAQQLGTPITLAVLDQAF